MIAGYKLSDVSEPAGDDYKRAVSVLLPYLLSHRTRLASLEAEQDDGDEAEPHHQLEPQQQQRVPVAASQERLQEASVGSELSDLDAQQRGLLGEAVDTAILKVRQRGPSAANLTL